MLQNASLLAIVAVDTEENEPIKNEVWWVRRLFLEPRAQPSSALRTPSVIGKSLRTAAYVRRHQVSEDIIRSGEGISHDTSLFLRLVLGCINTDFRKQIIILQHVSRSTK